MKKKKKNKNKILIAIFAVLFIIIALVVGISIYVKSCLKPTDAFLNGQVCEEGQDVPCDFTVFIVDEGAYGKSTLDKLQEKGIIKNSDIVYYYNRIFSGYSFAAGYFELPHTVDDGNGGKREGDFIRHYAEKIGESTTVSAQEILDYWNDEAVVRSYMKDYPFLTDAIFNENVKYLLEGYINQLLYIHSLFLYLHLLLHDSYN